MTKAIFTLALLTFAGVVAIVALEEVDRLLRRDWPFVAIGLTIWLVIRNPFRGRL